MSAVEGGVRLTPGVPTPTNTIANKPAGTNAGLYQSCLSLRDRLWCVPGFGRAFLDRSRESMKQSDPVSHLWQCFRMGTPLCVLYNHLASGAHLPPIPLSVDANLSNANACKALVMRFVIALKERLGWDPDDTFTVTQLYLNDTNGFVRVVRTVNRLLDEMEERRLLIPTPSGSTTQSPSSTPDSPRDKRELVALELLHSERKYVHDLEVMQNYAVCVAQYDIIPGDTIHQIFGNLNQLVDFQRRFLICLEENAQRPPDTQQLGHIFRSMEDDFSVYEPFCANYAHALQIVTNEASALASLAQVPAARQYYLDPSYELPTFLIKPVQRICKYPLLLEQLIKCTTPASPQADDLTEALNIIRRITDKVNETRRAQENAQIVADLEARVEDWKGHSLRTFGALLLCDTFPVAKGDTEREFRVYLFERILLCCKDLSLGAPPGRSRSKSGSLLKQRSGSVSSRSTPTALQLKGRIFLNNVVGISAVGRAGGADNPIGSYALQVWWRGENDVEWFSLRCKNDEQLKLWHGAMQRLLDELRARREQSSQATTPTSGVPPYRRGFMQVTTPIVGNSAELRDEDDPGSPATMRTSDSAPVDDFTVDEWNTHVSRPPLQHAFTTSNVHASPAHKSSSGNRPMLWRQPPAGVAPMSPHLVQSPPPIMPLRSASFAHAPPAPPPRTSAEALELDMQQVKIGPVPQRPAKKMPTATSTPRAGPFTLTLDSPGMQRTASESATSHGAPSPRTPLVGTPFGPLQSEFVSSPAMESNPYFPAMIDRKSSSSAFTNDSLDGARANSFSLTSSPESRRANEIGSVGRSPVLETVPSRREMQRGASTMSREPSTDSAIALLPGFRSREPSLSAGHCGRSDTSASVGVSPVGMSPGYPQGMFVRVRRGSERVQFAVPDAIGYAALYEQVTERVTAPGRLRLYHVDEDGDRVLLTGDDDVLTAMDYCRQRMWPLGLWVEG